MSKEIIGALIGGVAVVVAAIIGGYYATRGDDGPPPAPTPQGEEAVEVTIHDELGSNQYSESLNIEIDGQSKGDLVIQKTTNRLT